MGALRPLLPETLSPDAAALRDSILQSRAPVSDLIGLVADDGSLRGPFDPLLRTPEIGQAVQELGAVIRTGSTLEPGVTSAVTLVVVRAWDCGFEWDAHSAIALERAHLNKDDIARIAADAAPVAPRLALACEYASHELDARRPGGSARTGALIAEFGERGTVELTVLIAYYEMVCRLVRTSTTTSRVGKR